MTRSDVCNVILISHLKAHFSNNQRVILDFAALKLSCIYSKTQVTLSCFMQCGSACSTAIQYYNNLFVLYFIASAISFTSGSDIPCSAAAPAILCTNTVPATPRRPTV